MPLTWEETAQAVGVEIRNTAIGGYPDPLVAVDQFIDAIKAKAVDSRAGLMLIADEATSVYAVSVGVSREVALNMVLNTIAAKQADYGPQNILWAGLDGILLRMHDKTARIANLARREVPGNEPLADSWLDLVGYAIVGIMWLDGTFERPLARDLPKVEVVPLMEFPHEAIARELGVPNPFTQAEEDPDIKAAFRQFSAAATRPEGVEPDGDDRYSIEGGGAIEVHQAPDDSHTHVIVTDTVGGVLNITASAGQISLDSNGFACNSQRLAVILSMLLGAAEASLAWRNTNVSAEVPRD